MKRRWSRIIGLVGAGAVLFWLLPWLILHWSGYELELFVADGDRSQTPVVDVAFKTPPPALPRLPANDPVRNVVFLLGDGISFSQLYAARLTEYGAHGRLLLERFPVTGWQTNPSVDDVYTDSAASATALMTGRKADTYALSVDVDGRHLPTLAEELRDMGWAVGLITDSYLWDASLAASGVHHAQRYDLDRVASQLAVAGFDLLVGTLPDTASVRGRLTGGVDGLVQPLRDAGYEVIEDARTLPGRLHSPTALVLPTDSIVEGAPSLSEIAGWALTELTADGRPLFLFVESEEPDGGGHTHDFERIVDGILELDAVAEVALRFADGRSDTLVLATGDHETGGFTILSGSEDEPLAIRWATTHHTSIPVPVLAWGAGAESFDGIMDNTEITERLRRLLMPAVSGASAVDDQEPASGERSSTGVDAPATDEAR